MKTFSSCGLAIVLLSVVHSFGDPPASTGDATAVSELRLESGYLPLPISLQGDPSGREIRSIRIVGKISSGADGQGEIWLDSRSAELNAFGDVRVLTGMTELRELALSGHGFTDVGLDGLALISKLRNLRLFETSVTTNGVAALQTRLPGLQIEAWGRETR